MNVPRRARLLGFFVPVVGLLLIMPPMVHIFGAPGEIFGVPAIIAFLFAVWFWLIGSAYLLQRSLEVGSARDENQLLPESIGTNSERDQMDDDQSDSTSR